MFLFSRAESAFSRKSKACSINSFLIISLFLSSYFLEGKANITVDFNSIELTNIKSYSNKVVIKYHYINGLTSLPLAEIRKKPLKYDPSGFIEILNPPKSLKLFLK